MDQLRDVLRSLPIFPDILNDPHFALILYDISNIVPPIELNNVGKLLYVLEISPHREVVVERLCRQIRSNSIRDIYERVYPNVFVTFEEQGLAWILQKVHAVKHLPVELEYDVPGVQRAVNNLFCDFSKSPGFVVTECQPVLLLLGTFVPSHKSEHSVGAPTERLAPLTFTAVYYTR